MTRAEKIISHFNDGLSISQMEATGLYQMPQLPTVIFGLKRKGWLIQTVMRETRTGKKYARYVPFRRPDGSTVALQEDTPSC